MPKGVAKPYLPAMPKAGKPAGRAEPLAKIKTNKEKMTRMRQDRMDEWNTGILKKLVLQKEISMSMS